jgi:UDP-glucose 4-epimerase
VRLASSGASIEHVVWNFPDVELRVPAVGKAKELLDWSAKVDLEEGLLRTIYWYRQNRRELPPR